MAIPNGALIGPYEILASLGAGGMGEVYRARDSRLKREVALKIIPDAFALDPDRLARFTREAQVLASLNHPHIGAIYGFEDNGETHALVLELVDGETLADRIARGAMPLDEALPIARQIAEALEAAHEQGIIHRDLKPANIKVTPDGIVKVLDFGLAKLTDPTVSNAPNGPNVLSMSPTLTSPAMTTGVGVLLGTAAYMAPEQAKGRQADTRSDIWAFGCVLYETLTGQRAFAGDGVSDVLASVLAREPDWKRLPPAIPPACGMYLRRCLQKDPRQRVQAIGDVRLALAGAFETLDLLPAGTRASRGRLAWMAFGVALLAAAALAVPATRHLRETPPSAQPEMRTDISTPATTDPISFALSPDGRQLAFVASGDGPSRLWLRPLGATSAQAVPGTEGAAYPFWSPDSKAVAFFAEGKLKRFDIGGGRPQPITDAPAGRGGTWNQDGVILLARTSSSPLFRVPATGGEPVAITALARFQSGHRFPYFLPGGRQFLFFVQGAEDARGIYLGTLDSPEIKRLVKTDVAGAYISGSLLYLQQSALVAQHLDLSRGELNGDPVTIADPVGFDSTFNVGAFSVSAAGLVAYRTIAAASRQLAWFDRSGKMLGTMGEPDEDEPIYPRLSPDGRRVAVQRTVQGNSDIWLLDGARTTRFTFDASLERVATWSKDGSQIAFSSDRKGSADIYVKQSSGAGSEQLLLESDQDKYANFSPDGRFLLYTTATAKNQFDLWALPLGGDRKPFVFLNTRFDERSANVSPDGRWVAYQSDESGRYEIYLRPLPGPGGQWQISTSGGSQQAWRADGKELFYLAPDGRLMAAAISVKDGAIEPAIPVALFQTRLWGGGANVTNGPQYDVAADGRFLMDVTTEGSTNSPITLLQNWKPPAK